MNLNETNISITNFQEICRLCLNKFPSQNARFLICGTSIENHSLEEILVRLFKIEVKKDDLLPQYLCAHCIFTLGQIYNFCDVCQKSKQILDDIVEKATGKKICKLETSGQLRFILPKPAENAKVPIPRLHPVKKITEFQCGLCLLTFPTEAQLQKHKNAHKTLEQKARMKNAEKRASDNENKEDKNQEQQSGGDKSSENPPESTSDEPAKLPKPHVFKCTKCDATFTHKPDYTKHKNVHEKPMECPLCYRRFKTLFGFNNHWRIHTGERLQRDKIGRLIECEICRTVCSSYYSYRVHKVEKHSGGVKPHICQQCGRDFLTRSRLRLHLYTHTEERPILCSMCPGRFKNKFALNHHIKVVHTEEPGDVQVKCTKCDRVFDSVRKMTNHRSTHIVNRYLCSICGKRLGRRTAWVNHMRRHTGEKPYKCQYCDKAFVAKFLLTYHTNMHTGEKSYDCEVCGKGFLTPKRLRTHRKNHCQELYKCAYCNKEFLKESNLMRHLKTHEGAEEPSEEQEIQEDEEDENDENVQVLYVEQEEAYSNSEEANSNGEDEA